MRKEEKAQILESISAQLSETPNFYITDISGLNAGQTSKLRRECFEKDIKLVVVKNTLFRKALEALQIEEVAQVYPALEGPTAIMYCETPNAPAKLIKKFNDAGSDKPLLKAAYVQECAFVGADKLNELCNIKSREELIADVVALLQAPARNVISALQNGGPQTIAGLVKTLSEKE
ncbi:MAG: 50S ribosomal protein L10 [Bacteroidales bacterium]|nr:50S ribosomal protein L10 [Bacteroidales bacterium]